MGSLPIQERDLAGEVVVDLQRVPQVCVSIHPILNDKPLVLEHQWLQLRVNRRYLELARRIQSLE
jgi:hypothetical protein